MTEPLPGRDARSGSLRVAVLARAVHPLHGLGGLERHVFDLVRHLDRRGVAVTLVTRPAAVRLSTPSPFGPDVTLRVVPYATFPFAGRRGTTVVDRSTAYLLFGYRAGRLAARLAEAGEIDLVYGLGASALGYAFAGSTVRARVPLVLNPQGLEEFGGPDRRHGGSFAKRVAYGPLRAAVRRSARSASRVIATDRALEPHVREQLGVPASRIAHVPNAVDLERCDRLANGADGERLRAALSLAPAEALLVSVGRLEANKGFHILARALGRITDAPWRWVLIGDGPYRRTIERELADSGVGARSVLTGRVDERELHAWYEAATLFVHPTLYEGSSLVTLEAMAHGRAVVATRAGGLPDKVRPGSTGWLVAPGDDAALAAVLREAMAPGADLTGKGRAGRALVADEFSWEKVAGRLLALFEEVAGARRIDPLATRR